MEKTTNNKTWEVIMFIARQCNIVTTLVRLPPYPYKCTEGEFFIFFKCSKMSFKLICEEKNFFPLYIEQPKNLEKFCVFS